jgi:hypothetical protein
MAWMIEHELRGRRPRGGDAADLDALALALIHCELVTCDAFMADVMRRARLDAASLRGLHRPPAGRAGARDRLAELTPEGEAA